MMVGRLYSFQNGPFLEHMLVFGSVGIQKMDLFEANVIGGMGFIGNEVGELSKKLASMFLLDRLPMI